MLRRSASRDRHAAVEDQGRRSASFLTIPSDIVDLDDEEQLADVARRFIVPMLQPPGG